MLRQLLAFNLRNIFLTCWDTIIRVSWIVSTLHKSLDSDVTTSSSSKNHTNLPTLLLACIDLEAKYIITEKLHHATPHKAPLYMSFWNCVLRRPVQKDFASAKLLSCWSNVFSVKLEVKHKICSWEMFNYAVSFYMPFVSENSFTTGCWIWHVLYDRHFGEPPFSVS